MIQSLVSSSVQAAWDINIMKRHSNASKNLFDSNIRTIKAYLKYITLSELDTKYYDCLSFQVFIIKCFINIARFYNRNETHILSNHKEPPKPGVIYCIIYRSKTPTANI